jgi:hypothetical protein
MPDWLQTQGWEMTSGRDLRAEVHRLQQKKGVIVGIDQYVHLIKMQASAESAPEF